MQDLQFMSVFPAPILHRMWSPYVSEPVSARVFVGTVSVYLENSGEINAYGAINNRVV
jgi:hypothetical protein